jgi:hypothetical protein
MSNRHNPAMVRRNNPTVDMDHLRPEDSSMVNKPRRIQTRVSKCTAPATNLHLHKTQESNTQVLRHPSNSHNKVLITKTHIQPITMLRVAHKKATEVS